MGRDATRCQLVPVVELVTLFRVGDTFCLFATATYLHSVVSLHAPTSMAPQVLIQTKLKPACSVSNLYLQLSNITHPTFGLWFVL